MHVERKVILKKMQRQKVMTIVQFAKLMDCATKTVHRRFKEWKMFRSCNRNGKFYTMPEIPTFDNHGLWRHEGILFSKHGDLKKTLIQLIRDSQAGLSGFELEQMTGLAANNPIIYQLRDDGHLRVEKVMKRVALFDADDRRHKEQRAERENSHSVPLPKCEVVLIVLVEMIKNPGAPVDQIVQIMLKQQRKISGASIHKILEHYDLLKKTPDMT